MKQSKFLELYLSKTLSADMISDSFSSQERGLLEGKALMRKGQFSEALMVLNQLPSNNNILAILEKLTCLYQLGNFYDWNKEVKQLVPSEIHILIRDSDYSVIEAQLLFLCSKFLEEAGLIAEALSLLEILASLNFSEPARLAAKLRIHLQYGISSLDLEEIYNQLLSYRGSLTESDLFFEIQQALSLYESHHISLSLAVLRFEKSLEDFSYLKQDLNLIYLDLLEVSLSKGEVDLKLRAKCVSLDSLNLYEERLLQMAHGQFSDDWPFFLTQMSKANVLRLFRLLVTLNNSSSQEFLPFAKHIVDSLGSKNKKIWSSFLFFSSLNQTVDVLMHQEFLVFENKKAVLTPLAAKLLPNFFDGITSLSTDLLLQSIWDEQTDVSHYDRLKTLVGRLNQVLFDLTSIEKAFSYSKAKVTLDSRVVIKLKTK